MDINNTLADHITLLENHARLLAEAAGRFRSLHSAQSDELQAMALRAYQSVLEAQKARDILRDLARGNQQDRDNVTPAPQPATPGPDHTGSMPGSARIRKRESEDPADTSVSGSAKRRRVGPSAPFADLDGNVEYEDISEEVEARLRRQEQRRREASNQFERQGTKRKRERDSTGSLGNEGSRKRSTAYCSRPQTTLNPHADWTSGKVKRDWKDFPRAEKETQKKQWTTYRDFLASQSVSPGTDPQFLFAADQVHLWSGLRIMRCHPYGEHMCKGENCSNTLFDYL